MASHHLQELANQLAMEPHPEGGWFKRMYTHTQRYKDPRTDKDRELASAIIYLLEAGPANRWHRIDADEMWHHYKGAPAVIEVTDDPINGTVRPLMLGSDLDAGQFPQHLVKAGQWQRTHVLTGGDESFALMGCTVSPGFTFDGWEVLNIPE